MEEDKKCSLCGVSIAATAVTPWIGGNNPWPFPGLDHPCCDWCDEHLVLPLRRRIEQLEDKAKDLEAAKKAVDGVYYIIFRVEESGYRKIALHQKFYDKAEAFVTASEIKSFTPGPLYVAAFRARKEGDIPECLGEQIP
jgi:hypothetical protein